MPTITQNIDIDFNKPSYKILFTAQQGENGTRQYIFNFYNNDKPFSCSNDEIIEIQFDKPDGTTIVKDSTTYTAPWSEILSTNPLQYSFFLDSNICSVPGVINCKISIIKDNLKLKSTFFNIRVEGGVKSEKDIVSSSEYIRFENFIGKVDEIKQFIDKYETVIKSSFEHINDQSIHITNEDRVNWNDTSIVVNGYSSNVNYNSEPGKIDRSTGELIESSEYEETSEFILLKSGSTITSSGSPTYVYSYNANTKEYIEEITQLGDGEVYTISEDVYVRITLGQQATAFVTSKKVDGLVERVSALEENIKSNNGITDGSIINMTDTDVESIWNEIM